jgi:hypothetical protein
MMAKILRTQVHQGTRAPEPWALVPGHFLFFLFWREFFFSILGLLFFLPVEPSVYEEFRFLGFGD